MCKIINRANDSAFTVKDAYATYIAHKDKIYYENTYKCVTGKIGPCTAVGLRFTNRVGMKHCHPGAGKTQGIEANALDIEKRAGKVLKNIYIFGPDAEDYAKSLSKKFTGVDIYWLYKNGFVNDGILQVNTQDGEFTARAHANGKCYTSDDFTKLV
ncbi:hypothetical protein RI845_07470 [Thalassotalea nanhaiensis]|uniref:Uncharacterized protein n=1 Tax=Thalassotalea nanhaiensis TaxID=3065648 RepID=A0ABY9TMI1_9GAMM|nr:hypothetical protein RI845_07470 [Colwelliaceae bacterium SQ345]